MLYAQALVAVIALTTAALAARQGAFSRWFAKVAAVLGVAMLLSSAGSPLVCALSLPANSTNLFFLTAAALLGRRTTSGPTRPTPPVEPALASSAAYDRGSRT